jgi:hypothetical protein
LTAAARRALARAECEVLARQGGNIAIALNLPAAATWSGEGLAGVAAAVAAIQKSLMTALMRAIDKAGLMRHTRPAAAEQARAREVSELFDPARFDASHETYAIPSYDKTPAGGKPTSVAIRGGGTPAPTEHRKSKDRWHIVRKAKLRLSLESFIDWRNALDPGKPGADEKTPAATSSFTADDRARARRLGANVS